MGASKQGFPTIALAEAGFDPKQTSDQLAHSESGLGFAAASLARYTPSKVSRMHRNELLKFIAAALTSVMDSHYYEDERGFQGEFYAQLCLRLRDLALPEGALLREEYQKKLSQHGLRIRPDIILHEPFDPGRHRGRDEGNHAVM